MTGFLYAKGKILYMPFLYTIYPEVIDDEVNGLLKTYN